MTNVLDITDMDLVVEKYHFMEQITDYFYEVASKIGSLEGLTLRCTKEQRDLFREKVPQHLNRGMFETDFGSQKLEVVNE